MIRELLDVFGDDLRYVWRHLPLNDVHPNAQLAAEAAEAAAAQGAFWEMYDMLLAHQDELTPATSAATPRSSGSTPSASGDELRHHEHAARVTEDVASADASGVAGTPTFFVNGRRHQGAYDVGDPRRRGPPRAGAGDGRARRRPSREARSRRWRGRPGPSRARWRSARTSPGR